MVTPEQLHLQKAHPDRSNASWKLHPWSGGFPTVSLHFPNIQSSSIPSGHKLSCGGTIICSCGDQEGWSGWNPTCRSLIPSCTSLRRTVNRPALLRVSAGKQCLSDFKTKMAMPLPEGRILQQEHIKSDTYTYMDT